MLIVQTFRLPCINLGAKDKGNYDNAQKWYQQSLDVDKRLYGDEIDHPSISGTLHNLGLVAQNLGVYDDALEWYEQSLKMKKRIHGVDADHPTVVSTLKNLWIGRTESRPLR